MASRVVSCAGGGVWLRSAGAIDKRARNANARTNRRKISVVMGFDEFVYL
jgi:hypothetical protein